MTTETTIALSSCVPGEVIAKALNNAFTLEISVSHPKDTKDEAEILTAGGMLLKYRIVTATNGSTTASVDSLSDKAPLSSNTTPRRRVSSRASTLGQAPPFPFGIKAEDKASSSNEGKDQDEDGGNPTVVALRAENEALRRKLADLEANHKQSLATIKTFHQSQQQLFNDFVLLREKYDEAKSRMGEILWGYLPAQTTYCPSIPANHLALIETEKRVGDYDIGDKLGEGQFAIVYKCRRRRTDAGEAKGAGEEVSPSSEEEELALKIINKDRVSSLAALKRVDNEVLAQTTLRHRGILHIYDVINGRKGLYLIMDKGGKDLFDYSDENPERLGEGDCKRIARSIIDAIHHCHSQGIVHRDLKPENILLNTITAASLTPPKDMVGSSIFDVKICDFGLSATFVRGKKLNDFCGSPGFFAPEMITSGGYDGPAVDVWSIGCIILELTVGHEIFCDQWMPAYNYELLQDPSAFHGKLADCLCALEFWMKDQMHLSDERVEFILGLLTVDPNKRLTMDQVAAHEWVQLKDGSSFLTGSLAPHNKPTTPPFCPPGRSPPAKSRPTSPLGNSSQKPRPRPAPLKVDRGEGQQPAEGSEAQQPPVPPSKQQEEQPPQQQQQQQTRVAFTPGLMGDENDDDDDDDDDAPSPDRASKGEGGLAAWRTGMSQKARSKMEQKTTKGGDKGGKGMQLPPLEPMTPAVQGAKKIIKVGNELLLKATEDQQQQQGAGISPSSQEHIQTNNNNNNSRAYFR